MNATTNYIGNNKISRRQKSKETLQTVRRVHGLDETPQRYGGSTKRQAEVRSHFNASNAFLKCNFLPKLEETKEVSNQSNPKKIEIDFYNSLSLLADHYSIAPKPTKDFVFPYNIALALEDVKKHLKSKVNDWEEVRLIKHQSKTSFASEERYNTGTTLYFIPVIPLYLLSKNPKRKTAYQLFLSVFSYLYHIAEIPYYRQSNSYLYWMYDMVGEWLTSDDNDEEKSKYVSQVSQAEWIGEKMEQRIFNDENLKRFEFRLMNFKIREQFDKDCFDLATSFFSLWKQYPNETPFRNAQPNQDIDEEDEERNVITMHQYISFCADTKGSLFQMLEETINCEFQECTIMEEPHIVKHFDGREISSKSLDFENKIFPLLDELTFLLNSL